MEDSDWDGSLATGHPVVDEQHREIHRVLRYAETADDRPEERRAVLERLMDHRLHPLRHRGGADGRDILHGACSR